MRVGEMSVQFISGIILGDGEKLVPILSIQESGPLLLRWKAQLFGQSGCAKSIRAPNMAQ